MKTSVYLGAATALAAQNVRGANDRVNVAIVGLGGRGQDHLTNYLKISAARVAGLCDVNQAALERTQARVKRETGDTPKGYGDMRDAFADKSIDAVSMPLPNHWHALATVWACEAGKDVYIEKPASHNIFEGIQMTAAARKHGRMVQVGSQSRSLDYKIRAIQLLREGVIGELYLAKGLCYKRRKSIGRKPDTPVPPGLNWDFFLGPAPPRPFNELRFAYNWHWFWDTGNGDIGNQGVHEMDLARWGMGVGLPKSVVSTGGKFAYDDMQETPNTQLAAFDYGPGKEIVFEVRGLLTGQEGGLERRGGNYIGNLFYGSNGWMALDSHGFQVYKGESNEKVMDEKATGATWDTKPHMESFIRACQSRNVKDLTADIEVGATSSAMCHLANISYRLGGKRLAFDAEAMRFAPAEMEANRMLTRPYRKPYVVPTLA
jgi:predicted dehydrogenase